MQFTNGLTIAKNVIFTPFFRRALAPSKWLQNLILRVPSIRHNIVSWGQRLRIFPNLAILRDFLTSFSRSWFFRVIFGTFWLIFLEKFDLEVCFVKEKFIFDLFPIHKHQKTSTLAEYMAIIGPRNLPKIHFLSL